MAQTVLAGPEVELVGAIEKQRQLIRTGQYKRFGKLAALYFEVTRDSNPKMLELGLQKTPEGRMAWPGKNLDWIDIGPPLAWATGDQLLMPAVPFPLPPPVPDPTFVWKKPGDMPGVIPQLIEDRAVAIQGTRYLCIQPVSAIQWILDGVTIAGSRRREIRRVGADPMGRHMAFILDLTRIQEPTGHLVGGKVL